jgi:hypothetical protein
MAGPGISGVEMPWRGMAALSFSRRSRGNLFLLKSRKADPPPSAEDDSAPAPEDDSAPAAEDDMPPPAAEDDTTPH